jgi:nitrite reductase/ring-hydroxylating ferredoxin subunit
MAEIQEAEVTVCRFDDLDDPGCREFRIGEGDWPFRGFVVRKDGQVHAYQNFCMHVGHPLNWKPNEFLTEDRSQIICSSHGATYDIVAGECTGGPCKGRSLRRVAVEVRDGEIVVKGPNGLRR